LTSWQSCLADYLVLAPYDALVPGLLTVGDIADLAGALAPCRVRCEASVDGWNRRADVPDSAGGPVSQSAARTSAAHWLLTRPDR
jgi:hypothetical protein